MAQIEYFDGRRKKIPKTRSEVLITPLKNNRGQIRIQQHTAASLTVFPSPGRDTRKII